MKHACLATSILLVQHKAHGLQCNRLAICNQSWRFLRHGKLHSLNLTDQHGVRAHSDTYIRLLQSCITRKALAEAKQVHAHIIQDRIELNIHLGNTLVNLYAQCGSALDAHKTFNEMLERDLSTWTMLITGYIKHGHVQEAFQLFWKMEWEGVEPDDIVFISILKACNQETLEQGKRIHACIIDSVFKPSLFVENTLVDMYAKCGSIEDARNVFDSLRTKDVVSWNVMIAGYGQHGHGMMALKLFGQMRHDKIKPDNVTLLNSLKVCVNAGALEPGRQIHNQILQVEIKPMILLANTLVDMYAKCGSIEDARVVFDDILDRDAVSWNILIAGYAQHGHATHVIKLFFQMQLEGTKPDAITFLSILKSCMDPASLKQGKHIHVRVLGSPVETNLFVNNCLIHMYANCGTAEEARVVFNKMPKRDLASWNAMIAGYTQHGKPEEALNVFSQMNQEGLVPDQVTFVSLLKACASLQGLEEGKQIHACILRSGIQPNIFLENTLLDMYCKCRSVLDAQEVFENMPRRDSISWNAMVAGYAQHGMTEESSKLIELMEGEGVKPNDVNFVSILNVCNNIEALKIGLQLHSRILREGIEQNMLLRNVLVKMYINCGSLLDARQMFDQMPQHDAFTWTLIFTGYVQHGLCEEAFSLFQKMRLDGINADDVIFVSLLKVCAIMASLEQGKLIHFSVIRFGFESGVCVGSALIDMYVKCGSVTEAERVFEKMPARDVVSSNAMLVGYGQHGLAREGLQFFAEMQHEGLELTHVTFVAVLSACSHAGLVEEGYCIFYAMHLQYGIRPTTEHYACMIDLLARSGHVEAAVNFIKEMPCQATADMWMAILAACRICGNVELAKHSAECVLELVPQKAAALVLLSNTYAAGC